MMKTKTNQIPYLMNNSDTWMNISTQTIQALDKLQNLFYRVLLSVPVGCPIPIMYWDCAGLSMTLRIAQKKLLFLHHLSTMEEDSLAKEVLNVQARLAFPGLLNECEEYLVMFGVCDIRKYSDFQWKTFVKKNIRDLNRKQLLDWMKSSYKKLDHKIFMTEEFKMKPYLTQLQLDQARDNFRLRSFMTKTVKMNFPSDAGYRKDLWKCYHCPNIDTQSHIRYCPAYEKFRTNKDLDNDQDLVKYFREVIDMRENEETDYDDSLATRTGCTCCWRLLLPSAIQGINLSFCLRVFEIYIYPYET